jgi:hypothetical protein
LITFRVWAGGILLSGDLSGCMVKRRSGSFMMKFSSPDFLQTGN